MRLCSNCGCSIAARARNALYCFPCIENRPKIIGQARAAYEVAKAVRQGKLPPVRQYRQERAAFEAFASEWTGRDMDYHRRAGTWGLGEDSFAWACWQKAGN